MDTHCPLRSEVADAWSEGSVDTLKKMKFEGAAAVSVPTTRIVTALAGGCVLVHPLKFVLGIGAGDDCQRSRAVPDKGEIGRESSGV